MLSRLTRILGGTRPGVWLIKHVVSPLDRRLYTATGGRWLTTGRPPAPVVLLTTTGRRTGLPRTTAVFGLPRGEDLVVCNANPGFESTNPWVLNLRADPDVEVPVGRSRLACTAREAQGAELDALWTELVQAWPAYATHYARSGRRAVFVLSPHVGAGGGG